MFHLFESSSITSNPILCLVLSYCFPGFPKPTNNFILVSHPLSAQRNTLKRERKLSTSHPPPDTPWLDDSILTTVKDVTSSGYVHYLLYYYSLASVSLPSSFSGCPGSCSSPELISSSCFGGRMETSTVFSSSFIS